MSESRVKFEADKIYHHNLTNDEKLLEIEKKRRKSTRDNAEKHENKLWNFIKSITLLLMNKCLKRLIKFSITSFMVSCN